MQSVCIITTKNWQLPQKEKAYVLPFKLVSQLMPGFWTSASSAHPVAYVYVSSFALSSETLQLSQAPSFLGGIRALSLKASNWKTSYTREPGIPL